uniref:Mono-ADP ribosylhydrolase 2 n=1 Tax=Cyprinus carpio TaxID=7962 RepID=A0A8C1PQU8_CYPCA
MHDSSTFVVLEQHDGELMAAFLFQLEKKTLILQQIFLLSHQCCFSLSVDGCIHRAAGHLLYEECHALNGCETGKAKITCGYDLPAKYVIHTVGPIARGNVGQSQRDDLESCYKYSLKLMKDNNLRSVVSFPNEPAAEIALKTVHDWILSNQDEIDRVIFCVFLETDYEIFKRKMSDFFSPGNCIFLLESNFILFVGCNTHSAQSLLLGYQAGFTMSGPLICKSVSFCQGEEKGDSPEKKMQTGQPDESFIPSSLPSSLVFSVSLLNMYLDDVKAQDKSSQEPDATPPDTRPNSEGKSYKSIRAENKTEKHTYASLIFSKYPRLCHCPSHSAKSSQLFLPRMLSPQFLHFLSFSFTFSLLIWNCGVTLIFQSKRVGMPP